MKDEIPTARREYSLSAPTVRQYTNRRLLVLGGALLLGMGLSGVWLLSARTTPPVAPVAQAIPANVPEALPTAEPTDALMAHHAYQEAPRAELVLLPGKGKAIYLRPAAAAAFKKMALAARRDGVYLVVLSGFRDLQYQQNLFNRDRVRLGSVEAAQKLVAPPGYSEHHTGYALDIGDGKAPETNVVVKFEKTAASRWLKDNAPKYGFELSFDRENSQGVSYEPWHWRFVGDKVSLETFYRK